MMKQRILAIGMAAVLTIGTIVPVLADVGYVTEKVIAICQTEPTILTGEQLSELADIAPDITDTRSSVVLADRRITTTELADWSSEYWELGGLNAFELEVVRLINIERAAAGVLPLAINPQLSMAARFHSQEMADLRIWGHRSPHHGRGNDRAEMFGHDNIQDHVWGVRENIAGNTRCSQEVVTAWMNSPGHRAAILGEYFLTIGVGAVQRGGATVKFGS